MAVENIEIKQNLCENFDESVKIYQKLSAKAKIVIEDLIEDEGISVKSVIARTKDIESLERKIETKNYKYRSLNQITDLSGIRVITYYSDDVYRVEEIIRENFQVDSFNSIDKAKVLEYDRFGYLSLHYVVQFTEEQCENLDLMDLQGYKFEIQIRSILQDAWAEIEHDLGYKNKKIVPRKIKRDFSRLAGLLELADKEFQNIRDYINNYEDEIIPEVSTLTDIVAIDDVSIKSYIQHNKKYRELLYKMGEEVPIRKMNKDNDIAKQLVSVGIYSLNEVEDIIEDNAAFILKMLRYEKLKVYNFIGEADILLYVCYAKLLNGENIEKNLIRFWDENGYITKGVTDEHKLSWVENLKKYREED